MDTTTTTAKTVTVYKVNRFGRNKYFDSLPAATKFCSDVFETSNVVLGIVAVTKPAKKIKKVPSLKTLEHWLANGVAKATDGCTVEPDGRCAHGKLSWFLVLGVI